MAQAIAQITQKNLAHLKSQPALNSTRNGQNDEIANAANSPTSDDRVNKLFKELAGIYGYLWKSMHNTVEDWCAAKHWWAKKIKDFTDEEIDYAIEQSMTLKTPDGRYRLPILQEFIDFAQQKRRRDLELQQQAEREKIIKLPKPAVDSETVQKSKADWAALITKFKNKNYV